MSETITQAPGKSLSYTGYHKREIPAPDSELTSTMPGTPPDTETSTPLLTPALVPWLVEPEDE